MWNLSQEKQAIYDLFKIVFLIIFIAHFCGCAFYFFYTFERKDIYLFNKKNYHPILKQNFFYKSLKISIKTYNKDFIIKIYLIKKNFLKNIKFFFYI